MLAIALMEQLLQQTEAKLVEACEEIIETRQKLADSETERIFWKGACERALRLWELAQTRVDDLEDGMADSAYERGTRD